MDLSIRMRIIYNVKHRYVIRLKFGGKFLTFQTKLVLERKASICSTIKENLLFILSYIFSVCCRCHNLTYFYQVCITKKHRL